jgi:hypothetical protein
LILKHLFLVILFLFIINLISKVAIIIKKSRVLIPSRSLVSCLSEGGHLNTVRCARLSHMTYYSRYLSNTQIIVSRVRVINKYRE